MARCVINAVTAGLGDPARDLPMPVMPEPGYADDRIGYNTSSFPGRLEGT